MSQRYRWNFERYLRRLCLQVGILCGDRNRQSLEPVFSINPRWAVLQHAIHEIPHLGEVRVCKGGEEVIRDWPIAALGGQKSCRRLIQTSNQDRSLGADDFRAHVVPVNRLRARFNIANCTLIELQVNHTRDYVSELCDLGS